MLIYFVSWRADSDHQLDPSM